MLACGWYFKAHNPKLDSYNENGGVEHLWSTSRVFKVDKNIRIRGIFWEDFLAILRVGSGHFWTKWAGIWGVSGFQTPKIVDWCFRNEIRMFKQLSKASDAAKHSKPLVVVGCWELL